MSTSTDSSALGLRYEVVDGIAVMTLDQPGASFNTLSPDSVPAFEAALVRAENDPAVQAVVSISGKPDSFVVGANLEFLQTLTTASEAKRLSKAGQDGFNRVAAAAKPVVVAIHGACLGGGLEWALACHYRIASDSPKTTLGLPEVQLGLLPGAGGTQRLPRLIGLQNALTLILTGKPVKPTKARKLGLVDEVVPPSILRAVALARAGELAEGKLKPDRSGGMKSAAQGRGLGGLLKGLASKGLWTELALEENPLGRKLLFDQARKRLLQKTRGNYPAPEKALEVIRTGLELGTEAGLEAEAEAFGELVVSNVSRRLVEVFFATTALKKENGTSNPEVRPRAVKSVAVLGGGLMGGGIAYVTTAKMGVPVRIREQDDAGAARALRHVHGLYDERVNRRQLTWRQLEEKMALFSAGTDGAGFKRVDLVVEAVFEDLTLKHQVLRATEALTREDCIFASNTSSLPISSIAAASARPHTVIGMHYFSPVHKMPLLEVVTHAGTADWVTATCVDVGRRQGKTVIVVNDGVGFYTSRILAPYMNEAAFLLTEGADIAELDKALVNFGFPVGPVNLLDEVGIDVAEKVAKILHTAFGERMAPPEVLKNLTASGRLGRKNKKGFYAYDGKKKKVDASVYALLGSTERKSMDRAEMAERCVLQMVNEAFYCLGEGVLRSARDGDVGALFGLGFPAFLGGPFRYADSLGPVKVLDRVEFWQKRYGVRFTPAPLLVESVRKA